MIQRKLRGTTGTFLSIEVPLSVHLGVQQGRWNKKAQRRVEWDSNKA